MGSTYSKDWRTHIPSGGINDVVASWHFKQSPREQSVASPSTLTECPRVVWLKKNKTPYTNDMGWGTKQRMMLGRIAENLFATQLKDEGKLIYHWKDDFAGESVKFGMGEGLTRVEGTPDFIIKLNDKILLSDSKTSRADSFAYVPTDNRVWEDELWYKYKLQIECYFMLCHKNKDWFESPDIKLYGKNIHEQVKAMGDLTNGLPLPEACHLFSYALDDGVVKREFTWQPSQKTASEILHYVKRWNTAYQSETIPDCQCTPTQIKFCPYAEQFEYTKTNYKLGTHCCSNKFKEETSNVHQIS